MPLGAHKAAIFGAAGGEESFAEYTKLLCNFEGADGSTTFTDESGNETITAVSMEAEIDTDYYVGGSSSVLISGAGRLYVASSSLSLTGDFTIEFDIRFSTVSGDDGFMRIRENSSGLVAVGFIRDGSTLRLYASTNGTTHNVFNGEGLGGSLAANTWYTIALVREGTTWSSYRDGTRQWTTTATAATLVGGGSRIHIGGDYASTYRMDGWMDRVRITNGAARWSGASYTVPSGNLTLD